MDGRGEHVDPDERQVALRLRWLLLQADNLAGLAKLRDAELARIVHLGEHDLRVRPGGTEFPDQMGDPADDEVVA